MSSFWKRCAVPAAALACALVAPPEPAAAAPLKEVKARGKLIALAFPNQENRFVRVDVERGLGFYEGINVDLMQEFACALGVTLEVRPVKPTFGAQIPALLAGEGDLIASSFTITPERRAQMIFSQPYFELRKVVVAKKSLGLSGPADLAGRKGSVVIGSNVEDLVRKISRVPPHRVEFTRWNYDAITEGEAEFAVLDGPAAWHLLPLYPDLEIAFTLPGVDHYGFALAPGSEDLRDALDAFLAGIQQSGQLAEIVRRHLGESGSSGVADRPATRAGLE
jgi:polar amino acid transport system substrate-binding protein